MHIAAPVLARHLCLIFNTSIANDIFPNLWKHAKVCPVFKSGNQTEMNNYRPMSVLSILSKIFEKNVHDSFYCYLSNYDLISPHHLENTTCVKQDWPS